MLSLILRNNGLLGLRPFSNAASFAAQSNLKRSISVTRSAQRTLDTEEDINDFLSKPTWSVESLLPTEGQIKDMNEVTSQQLHHLLRLSALPPPSGPEEEAKMLNDLQSQLHFVKAIQKVDTTGVEPLRSIRDETAAAEKEMEFGMDSLKDVLAEEEIIGTHHKRIRRKPDSSKPAKGVEDWDVLGQATSKVGKYFVVHSGES